jgi:Family of unknown function (DUF6533)
MSTEIRYIWKNKVKLGTALYLLARYTALLHFLVLVILVNSSNFISLEVCFF